MKKVFVLLIVALLLTIVPAYADETSVATVTVTNGGIMAHETVSLRDTDGDGKLTISDALYLVHEAKYDGGAEAGFLAEDGAYGKQLSKLWGVTGTGFGYYVNNASAMSLGDEIGNGDKIVAYVYTDTTGWSDTYCYFDKTTVTVGKGGSVTLTLTAATFNANWEPVSMPVANAVILIDGQATQYKTDADGKVTVPLTEAGTVTISATSDTMVLVPPVCVATVRENPPTADGTAVINACAVAMLIITAVYILRRRTENEA